MLMHAVGPEKHIRLHTYRATYCQNQSGRSGARPGIVVDEVADEVGDVLVDEQDGYVLALGVVLEGVLHLPHRRLCTREE